VTEGSRIIDLNMRHRPVPWPWDYYNSV